MQTIVFFDTQGNTAIAEFFVLKTSLGHNTYKICACYNIKVLNLKIMT